MLSPEQIEYSHMAIASSLSSLLSSSFFSFCFFLFFSFFFFIFIFDYPVPKYVPNYELFLLTQSGQDDHKTSDFDDDERWIWVDFG